MKNKFKKSYTFNGQIAEVYSFFGNKTRIRQFMPTELDWNVKVGGTFAFNGMQGVFVEMAKNKNITFAWRMKKWDKGFYSMMNITFSKTPTGKGKITIECTNLPNAKSIEDCQKKWDMFFNNFKESMYKKPTNLRLAA